MLGGRTLDNLPWSWTTPEGPCLTLSSEPWNLCVTNYKRCSGFVTMTDYVMQNYAMTAEVSRKHDKQTLTCKNYAQVQVGSQSGDMFGDGQKDCNLCFHKTTKTVFGASKMFLKFSEGGNGPVPPCCGPESVFDCSTVRAAFSNYCTTNRHTNNGTGQKYYIAA